MSVTQIVADTTQGTFHSFSNTTPLAYALLVAGSQLVGMLPSVTLKEQDKLDMNEIDAQQQTGTTPIGKHK